MLQRKERNMLRSWWALITLLLCSLTFAADWPQWRGPAQNGVSRETNLPDSWSPEGQNVAWCVPVGGMSSPIVMKNHVYMLSRSGEEKFAGTTAVGPRTQETVVCLDANTGDKVWEHKMNM